MITHLVVAKPRASLPTLDREAFVAAFERAVSEIETVRAVRVGRRITHGAHYELIVPDAADFLIEIDFENLAGLQTYLRHPAHEALGRLFRQSLDSGWAYDFETGGAGALREFARLEEKT